MATTTVWYAHALLNAFKGLIDFEGATIKVMLCPNTYVPLKNGHEFRADVIEVEEVTGYTLGGQDVLNRELNLVANELYFDCDDPEWTIAGTLTCRYLVYYISTGDEETDILLCCVDLGENVSTTDNIFRPVVNEAGLLKGVC